MAISRTDFMKKYQVVFRAEILERPIAPQSLVSQRLGYYSHKDVIDLNGDSRVNRGLRVDEDHLLDQVSLRQLRNRACREEQPILSSEIVGNLLATPTGSTSNWRDSRSLNDLARANAPTEPDAQAGIDLDSGEFLIYVPRRCCS